MGKNGKSPRPHGRARLMAMAIFIILYRGVSCLGPLRLPQFWKMGRCDTPWGGGISGKRWSVCEERGTSALNSRYVCNDLMILIDFPWWMDGKTVFEFNVQPFLPLSQHKSGWHRSITAQSRKCHGCFGSPGPTGLAQSDRADHI